MILFLIVIPILVAVTVFLILLLILKICGCKSAAIKALIFGVASAVALVGLVFLMFVGSLLYSIRMPREEFNKDLWHNEPKRRYTMSHDVMSSKMLIGNRQSEVLELLGCSNVIEQDSLKIVYFTGQQPSLMTLIPRSMEIYFEKSKVVRVELNATDSQIVRDYIYNENTTE